MKPTASYLDTARIVDERGTRDVPPRVTLRPRDRAALVADRDGGAACVVFIPLTIIEKYTVTFGLQPNRDYTPL